MRNSNPLPSHGPGIRLVPSHDGSKGEPLPNHLQTKLHSQSGEDFSDVRVHKNSMAAQSVGAKAYVQGHDIHIAPGQEQHLPHEAWHVVQQGQAGRLGRVIN